MSTTGFPDWRQAQVRRHTQVTRTPTTPGSGGGGVLGVRGWFDFLTGPSALKPSTDGALMAMLDDAIPQLWKDVSLDACPETYGPGCAGTDAEADAFLKVLDKKYPPPIGAGGPGGAKQILIDAGVDPTEANIAAFAACVKKSKDTTGMISVPRGTLAKCAMEVKRHGSAPAVHSTKAWRDAFETWQRTYGVWREKIKDSTLGIVPSAEVEGYRVKYNALRETFRDKGGRTDAPPIDGTQLVPTWVWVAGGAAVAIYVATQIRYIVSGNAASYHAKQLASYRGKAA